MTRNVQQLLTEHIDLWTSAIENKSSAGRGNSRKKSLYGIKKLRELILELAVRGKLVEQDPDDEPAPELLKRIAAERDRLVKAGEIKKPKKLPEIGDEEKPFELPNGWEWSRLQNVSEYIQRGKGPVYADKGTVRVISQKCIQLSGFEIQPAKYVSEQSLDKYQPERFLKTNDLLWNSTGTGTVGRINILANITANSLVADSHVTVIRTLLINSEFLCCYISAPGIQNRIDPTHENTLVSGSTKQVELNTTAVITLPIVVPPLKEQHRIVAKVGELMALCDQLEQQTEQQLDAHQLLVDTLLGTLTQSQNANELADNWTRLSQHFDTLFTTEASIDQLKQTILQLAVMGKLVPQNPNDEPASELLKRIAAEKEQLIKDKKIKKQKPLPPISEEEKLFELPIGWRWVQMDDICYGITSGSTPPKNEFSEESGIPYLKVYNIRNQSIDFEYKKQFITPEYHSTKLMRSNLYPGDVVMNIVGPPLGKIAIIPDDYPEWNCNQAMVFFRPIMKQMNHFLYTYLCSGIFLEKIVLIGTAGQDNISVTKSRSIFVPLPPITEQNRIVTKTNELFTLCDQLKERLQHNQQTQLLLTDTLVQEALV